MDVLSDVMADNSYLNSYIGLDPVSDNLVRE